MIKRVQEIDGDIVLEITEESSVKTRLSEKSLLRKQEKLTASIFRFEDELIAVRTKLALLYEEHDKLKG